MIDRIVDILCMCGGVRKDALRRVPQARAQAATLGLLMILTAIVAGLTSGYALSRAFLGDAYASIVTIGGGAAWGSIVFCIDRLMLLGLDKFASTARLILQVSIRVPLAVTIALVMSKPFILRLSETVIAAELRRQQRETIGKERTANAQEANLDQIQKTVSDLKTSRQKQEERLREEPDSHRYRVAKDEFDRADERYQRVLAANGARITRASTQIARIREGSTDGQMSPDATSRIAALQTQIGQWRQEIGRDHAAFEAAQTEKDTAAREWVQAETEGLTRIGGELKGATAEQGQATSKVNAQNAEAEQSVARIMAPNLVNQYRTLRRITADPKHPDSAAIRIFELGLDVLFLILELTPVLLKALAKKCALDHAIAAVEFVDQERINIGANVEAARLQKISEVGLAVEEEAIEKWGDGLLNGFRPGKISSGDLHRLHEELVDMIA